jgi:hypothetical protein
MWCQNIPQYEIIVRMRLMNALVSSDRWKVETPKQSGDLCVIAMNFSEEPKQFHTLPDIYAPSINIKTIDDVKTYFPVCWKSRKNRHTLEFHNTFVKALATKHSVDELEIRRVTMNRLMNALRQDGWNVELPAKVTTSEICTVNKM